MSHESALTSWMWTFGSSASENKSIERHVREVVGRAAGRQSARAPVVGKADLVVLASVHAQWSHSVCNEDARLDRRAGGRDGGPTAMFEAALTRKIRVHLHEHLRL